MRQKIKIAFLLSLKKIKLFDEGKFKNAGVFFLDNIRVFHIVFMTLIFLFSAVDGRSQEPVTKKVQVVGTGMVHGEDVAAARDQAITNSFVSAVDRVISDIIPDESVEKNFKIINEILFNHTGNFIRKYKVLNESESGRNYRALVSATVWVEKVREQLASKGILLSEANLPSVIFFIAEQRIGDILPQYWWGEEPYFIRLHAEKAMAEVLEQKGFKIIDHQGIDLYREGSALVKVSELDEAENFARGKDEAQGEAPELGYVNDPYLSNAKALKLGQRLGAEVIIVGLAKASIVPNTMGETIRSFKATVEVNALRTDTGEVIVSLAREAVAVNADENDGGEDALKNAGALAGMVLANRISEAGKQGGITQEELRIYVKGTGNLGRFVNFRKRLGDLPGVSGLQILQIKPDEALLKVNFKSSSEDLAETLLGQSFDTFGINISEIKQKQLKIELIPIKNNTRGE